MSSSKIILVGAISVVFGLYTLSLTRVESLVGTVVVTNSYMVRAGLNARTGVQRALHRWTTGNFESSFGPTLVGDSSSSNSANSSYFYTCSSAPTISYLNSHYDNDTLVQLTIVSHGIYKAWGEPNNFQGHEVVRTAYATFLNSDLGPGNVDQHLYDVQFKMAIDSINFARERQLDSLQQFK
jgi:hypothetical protein